MLEVDNCAKIIKMPFLRIVFYFSLNYAANNNFYLPPFLQNPPGNELIVISEVLEEGEASYYGDDFHGKRTANSEVYDMNKLTAAHPYLPFHTILEVENLENERKVLVRINDRGPFIKNRIIDLSVEAARRIDMLEKGVARVRLKIFKKFSPENIPSHQLLKSFILQLGAFSNKNNAENFLNRLQKFFTEIGFKIIYEDRLFKVVTASEFSEEELKMVQEKFKKNNVSFFVRSSKKDN